MTFKSRLPLTQITTYLLLVLALTLFAGCKSKSATEGEAANTEQNQPAEQAQPAAEEAKGDDGAAAPAEEQPADQADAHDHEGHDHDGMNLPPSSEADKADPNANKLITPPITVEQVPDGAWYCYMGSVHYYRHEKGDGKCPLCGMELKEKTAEAK